MKPDKRGGSAAVSGGGIKRPRGKFVGREPQPSHKKADDSRTAALLALSSVPLIMTLGNSMLIPVLPAIETALGITPLQASLIITVYSVMAIILIPIAGYLSDRIGRKKVIIPSLILAGAGGAVCGWAGSLQPGGYGIILAGRVLQGIGAAGAMPIVLPLVGDMFRSEQQVSAGLGLIETSNTFGKVLSPILGSALALLAWQAPFWSVPILCALSIILVLFLVKVPPKQGEEAAAPPPPGKFLSGVWNLYRSKAGWLTALFVVGCFSMFILFGLLFYLSETLEKSHHMKGILKGLVLAIPLAVLCAASYAAGKWIGEHKKVMKWTVTGGFLLCAASIAACLFWEATSIRIALLSGAGLGIGAGLPCLDAFITEGIDKEERGTISSLYSSMRFIGVAAGPPVASLLMKQSAPLLLGVMASVAAAAFILALAGIRPRNDKG
ncbi:MULTISPECIES: MFS transporter [Paenibacillus]|uniref:MFS transporter n=1 Tax=Paenibacillus TaxID=44249 RepID=UPI000402428F|nr:MULTISPECIES: MFS transporter [Paenibacillus]CDN44388.1 Bacillibactin exporter [Paenibacillus sp. P22]